ncbi:MAG: hemerythrin domain-containing protein [Euryarchaeota archaeon]|nr:hemerythrin domain-containing protein [Euryarchaeota archaeon]
MTVDVLGLFELHHQRLLRSMEELAHARRPARRTELFQRFQTDLRHHFRAEERVLFPRAQETVLTRGDADLFVRGRAEHSEQLRLLESGTKRLEDASAISVLVFHVSRELQQHFRFEEDRLFPAARRALGRPALLKLAEGVDAEPSTRRARRITVRAR